MFTVRSASLSEIIQANELIPEFTLGGRAYFEERLEGKTALLLVACDGDTVAGYGVSYLQDSAAYIWIVGTLPDYRRRGVYQHIFRETFDWAKANGAHKLQLKTRNSCRNMLAWLVKNDFQFMEIEAQADSMDNRILTEKVI